MSPLVCHLALRAVRGRQRHADEYSKAPSNISWALPILCTRKPTLSTRRSRPERVKADTSVFSVFSVVRFRAASGATVTAKKQLTARRTQAARRVVQDSTRWLARGRRITALKVSRSSPPRFARCGGVRVRGRKPVRNILGFRSPRAPLPRRRARGPACDELGSLRASAASADLCHSARSAISVVDSVTANGAGPWMEELLTHS